MHDKKKEIDQSRLSSQAPATKKTKIATEVHTRVMVERPTTRAMLAPATSFGVVVVAKQTSVVTTSVAPVDVVKSRDKAATEATNTLSAIRSKHIHDRP